MADTERRQRTISTAPRLSPEEIANRAFGTSFRGLAEGEVRSFLRRVADDLAAVREREQDLLNTIDVLEAQLRAPRPLDEAELLEALGEETTRLLRSARESADDIRAKAEERATRIMDDAHAEARRMRHEAEEILAARLREADTTSAEVLREAEERAAELRSSADRHVEEQRSRAEREGQALLESARDEAAEMVEEAKHLRERVLADLARRRSLLQAQLEELRTGRDRLLDAFRVVKRTFLEATDALAHVEARPLPGRPAEPASGPAAEVEAAPEAVEEVAEGTDVEDVAVAAAGTEEAAEPETAPEPEPMPVSEGPESAGEGEAALADERTRAMADVDSLFARIRAGRTEPTDGGPSAEAAPEATEEPGDAEASSEEPAVVLDEPPEVEREPWIVARAELLDSLGATLTRQAKRAAQDDQNALLDSVRRHKGRPSAAQVLPAVGEFVASWAAVLRAGLEGAYRGGHAAAGGADPGFPSELATELAASFASTLHERLVAAVDAADETGAAVTAQIVDRVGARYREWKHQSLDDLVADALATAWARGVYDATPGEAVLHWVVAEGGCCPDCDDNALEPTARGTSFPTGQPCPPAHAGCRCLLALPEAAEAPVGSVTA